MNKLKYWRLKRAISVRELATKSGVDKNTISRLENGNKGYSVTLGKLAIALEIEFEELQELESKKSDNGDITG